MLLDCGCIMIDAFSANLSNFFYVYNLYPGLLSDLLNLENDVCSSYPENRGSLIFCVFFFYRDDAFFCNKNLKKSGSKIYDV